MQLFDSWAGQLSPADYRRYVLPHSAKVLGALAGLGVPRIHFGVGTGELLEQMADAGADVVGVDWRVDLADARRRLGSQRRAGQPRPGRVPQPVARRGGQGPPRCWRPTRGGRATSSTSATVCCPRPTRPCWSGSCELVHAEHEQVTAAVVTPTDRVAVLLMAYGTPAGRGDVEAYYTDIRRGRPPTPEQLADLVRRYDAIGGTVAARRPHRGAAGRRCRPRSTLAAPAPSRWCSG